MNKKHVKDFLFISTVFGILFGSLVFFTELFSHLLNMPPIIPGTPPEAIGCWNVPFLLGVLATVLLLSGIVWFTLFCRGDEE